MDWIRGAWYLLAALAVTGVTALVIGLLVGETGLAVTSVSATGQTPTNATVNCDDVVVRQTTVSVTVEREPLGVQNPQWWGKGVSVRATVEQTAKTRLRTLGPGTSRTFTISFTTVRESSSAPSERITAVVQVVSGNVEVGRETAVATFDPVKAGRDC